MVGSYSQAFDAHSPTWSGKLGRKAPRAALDPYGLVASAASSIIRKRVPSGDTSYCTDPAPLPR